MVFTNTTLADDSAIKQIWLWDEASHAAGGQRYINYARESSRGGSFDGGWPAGSPLIPAGRAFWVNTDSTVDWTEIAPYREEL